jgi:hypothetical protein
VTHHSRALGAAIEIIAADAMSGYVLMQNLRLKVNTSEHQKAVLSNE